MTDNIWKHVPPYNMPGTNLTLHGYSQAAVRTSFYIPELRVMLDCGISNTHFPDHIFVTHGHMDHSLALPTTIVELGNFKNKSDKKPSIYAPYKITSHIQQYIHSAYVMSKNNPRHLMDSKYNLINMVPGFIDVTIRNKPWRVYVYQCDHTVPCLGYGFCELREKLKPEYHNLTGQEIGKLKKNGVSITETIEFPQFCYLGDSTHKPLLDSSIFKYPTIMLECTFLEDEYHQLAVEKKHTLWSDISPIIEAHPKNNFILYHFSARYKREDVERFFADKTIPNVHLWI